MKKLIMLWVLSGILIGCSTTGPMVAQNGKTYYVNSDTCARYRWWPNEDKIECFDSDGNSHGYAYPMTQQSLNAYYQRQAQIQRDWENFNENLRRNNEMQMRQNQMLMQQNQRMLDNMRLNNNLNCLGKAFCTMY